MPSSQDQKNWNPLIINTLAKLDIVNPELPKNSSVVFLV
jgi:hypothetical protein